MPDGKPRILTPKEKEVIKSALIRSGFLLNVATRDSEFVRFVKQNPKKPNSPPMCVTTLLYIIQQNEDLRKFRDSGRTLIFERLLDHGYAMALGFRNKDANISEKTQMDAIKFVARILRPDLFKETNITLQQTAPGIILQTGGDNGETVREFLKQQKLEDDTN